MFSFGVFCRGSLTFSMRKRQKMCFGQFCFSACRGKSILCDTAFTVSSSSALKKVASSKISLSLHKKKEVLVIPC